MHSLLELQPMLVNSSAASQFPFVCDVYTTTASNALHESHKITQSLAQRGPNLPPFTVMLQDRHLSKENCPPFVIIYMHMHKGGHRLMSNPMVYELLSCWPMELFLSPALFQCNFVIRILLNYLITGLKKVPRDL